MQRSIGQVYIENPRNMDLGDIKDESSNTNRSNLYPLVDPTGEKNMASDQSDIWNENNSLEDSVMRAIMANSSMATFLHDMSRTNSSLWDTPVVEGAEEIPTLNEMSIIKTTVLSVIFVISLIGNTMTVHQMYKIRRRRSTINLLILHLAMADLIVTFFCDVTEAVWASTIQWYAGDSMCKLVKFLQAFGLYLSTYIVVIISIDRCMAILDPMSRNKAPKRVKGMIIFAWLISAIFSVPQTYIFRLQKGPFKQTFYQCVTHGAYTEKWQEQLYSCLSVIFMFVIPLVTMVIAYLRIFCTISQKSRDLQREESINSEMLSRGPVRGQLFRKAKVKSLRMTALIVVAFIICWTPYFVLFFILTFLSEKIDTRAVMWIFFFGMANSMVNPMIYGAFHFCRSKRRNPVTKVKFGQLNSKSKSSTPKDHTSSKSSSGRAMMMIADGRGTCLMPAENAHYCRRLPHTPRPFSRKDLELEPIDEKYNEIDSRS